MGIKHEDTKTAGETGHADEWNKDHIIDGDVECAKHEHHDHVIENRTDMPAGPVAGQIIYRTDTKTLYIWDGTTWKSYPPTLISCRCYRNANQSILDDTATDMIWTSEDWDNGSTHDPAVNPERIYFPEAGIYLVQVSIRWFINNIGRRTLSINAYGNTDGGAFSVEWPRNIDLYGWIHRAATTIKSNGNTDYVKISVRQTSGAPLNISSSKWGTWICVTKVAEE